MNIPILSMIKKEFIEMKRTQIIKLLIIAPILQAIIFGYVATTDIKNVKTIICDEDNTSISRSLIDKFKNSEYFKVVSICYEDKLIDEYFRKNKAIIGLRIPKNFSKNVKKVEKVYIQLIADGTDSNQSLITLNRAIVIIQNFSNEVFKEKIEIMKKFIGDLPSLEVRERNWFNPELKSANMMVPGVIGLILMIVTLVITALAIVREKETGNIEQLIVTPITQIEIIIGKIVPYIIIGLLDIILITLMCILVFGIDMQGSFLLLVTLSLFMIMTNLGIGIFISTVSATQQQAMLTAIFFIFPNILLSGFLFPIKNMPEILQMLTYFIPMRYFMVIIRGIFLKGATFMELVPQVAALFIFGIIIFSFAIAKFKKTLS